jgi:hypothetical protein
MQGTGSTWVSDTKGKRKRNAAHITTKQVFFQRDGLSTTWVGFADPNFAREPPRTTMTSKLTRMKSNMTNYLAAQCSVTKKPTSRSVALTRV